MAVDAWPLRVRLSFYSAGIHESSTAAPRIRSRKAAITSTSVSRRGRIVKCGS